MAQNGLCIVVLPAENVYEAITAFQTPVGQNLTSDHLNQWLKELQKDQPLNITHLRPDLVQGDFTSDIKDPIALAKKITEIYSDAAEGDLEQMALHLKSTRHLTLWWD